MVHKDSRQSGEKVGRKCIARSDDEIVVLPDIGTVANMYCSDLLPTGGLYVSE
jgi:hypothetical protein